MCIRDRLKDTEGPGRQRGAPSLEVTFGPIGCDVDVAFVSDGTTNGPTGVRGGGAGGQSRQYLRQGDGTLGATDPVAVQRLGDGESNISTPFRGAVFGTPRGPAPAAHSLSPPCPAPRPGVVGIPRADEWGGGHGLPLPVTRGQRRRGVPLGVDPAPPCLIFKLPPLPVKLIDLGQHFSC